MTTINVNGKEIKLDGNVIINITDSNVASKNKNKIKEIPKKEKERTTNPVKIYDNVTDSIAKFPRVKDFAMSLGYPKNNKFSLNGLMSIRGVSDRYSIVTPKNMKPEKHTEAELNFLDNAPYPILPNLLVDM